MKFGVRRAFRALVALSALLLTGPVLHAQVLVTDWGGNLTNYNPTTNMSNVLTNAVAQPTVARGNCTCNQAVPLRI